MASPRQTIARAGALFGVMLLVAACGSRSNTSTTNASTSSSSPAAYGGTPAPASSPSAAPVKIATAKGSMGTYLVGPSGRALYLWAADKNGTSSCSGSCAQTWTPLTTQAKPLASGAAMAADLGTTKRSDGGLQVTYKGHPLYYFTGDSGSGTTKGQGTNSFGAQWWLLAPSGSPITGSGSSSGSSSSTSSTSSSSNGGGWG